jgi:hypothetical protein
VIALSSHLEYDKLLPMAYEAQRQVGFVVEEPQVGLMGILLQAQEELVGQHCDGDEEGYQAYQDAVAQQEFVGGVQDTHSCVD